MDNCLKLYINGDWVDSDHGDTMPVINPATGKTICFLNKATVQDLDNALQSAAAVERDWGDTPSNERAEILNKAADHIEGQAENIARVLTLEQGKPLFEAKGEVIMAIKSFRWAANEIGNISNKEYTGGPGNYQQKTDYEPIGVIAGFSPWNFPIMLTARKIAFALAAGCPIIIKPAEEAPSASLSIAQALHASGLPAGVLNMVFGDPALISEHLIRSDIVKKVSLTGSAVVGKLLAKIASDSLTPCVLELGGHAPVIIFDDVDVEETAKDLAFFKFRNAGQVCISPSRFFIHENIVSEFTKYFLKYAEELSVGDGLDENTSMGPLAHENRLDAVDKLVKDAIKKGAICLLGGQRIEGEGYFYKPTILSDVPAGAELLKTEIFGPVAVLTGFSDIDDMLLAANDTPYGLASYLFTRDTNKINYIKPRLDAGLVSINITTPILENVPFGGVKQSGYGYEGGREGLLSYMNLKLIHEA